MLFRSEKLEKEVFSDMLYNKERGYACVRPNLNMKLIRNVVISKVIKDTPDSIDIGDDLAVSYLSILRSKNIYISNNIGYHYRIHEESMTHNIKSNYFENIGCLYNYLSKSFNAGSYANCMIGQLNGYMEYLLSEGSHHLLGVSKSRNKIFLFPYEMVPPKTKIAIYGAGEVGIDYMKQLEQNHYCDVVCWVDKNYISKQQQGYKVSSPLELQSCEVDIILVAIENENVARSVRDTYLGENETAKWLWTLPIVID